MVTPIKNKAWEVGQWISSFVAPDPSPKMVKAYIDRRWPDLEPSIKHDILIIALGENF